MKYQQTCGQREYFKIVLACMEPDGCRVLKGPREEKRLAEILIDDYNVSRYEKMHQLVVREMVEENAQKRILQLFSTKHLQEEFARGKTEVSCSYQRKVDGRMKQVRAAAFPRRLGRQGQLEEFMVYVSVVGNENKN